MGAVQPYADAVVRSIPEPASGALHLLHQPVRALRSGVGDAGVQEDQHRRPPRLHGAGEGGELIDVGVGAPDVELVEGGGDLVTVAAAGGAAEQLAELFLGDPGGEDL